MRSTTICTPTTLNYRTSRRLHLLRLQSRTSKNVSKRCTIGARPSGFNSIRQSEIIWFGTRATLKHLHNTDLRLHVGADSIAPSEVVRDLGVFLDSELTMRQHVGKITKLCYYHLRRLKKVRRILGPTITSRLVSAFVTSRLDYCNALFAGLPQSTIALLTQGTFTVCHYLLADTALDYRYLNIIWLETLNQHLCFLMLVYHFVKICCKFKITFILLFRAIVSGN